MKRRSTSDPLPTELKPQTPELEERIRCRAYALYEQRGRFEGHDVDDWLQAEAELSRKSKTTAA